MRAAGCFGLGVMHAFCQAKKNQGFGQEARQAPVRGAGFTRNRTLYRGAHCGMRHDARRVRSAPCSAIFWKWPAPRAGECGDSPGAASAEKPRASASHPPIQGLIGFRAAETRRPLTRPAGKPGICAIGAPAGRDFELHTSKLCTICTGSPDLPRQIIRRDRVGRGRSSHHLPGSGASARAQGASSSSGDRRRPARVRVWVPGWKPAQRYRGVISGRAKSRKVELVPQVLDILTGRILARLYLAFPIGTDQRHSAFSTSARRSRRDGALPDQIIGALRAGFEREAETAEDSQACSRRNALVIRSPSAAPLDTTTPSGQGRDDAVCGAGNRRARGSQPSGIFPRSHAPPLR